jgi:hypothetical protein
MEPQKCARYSKFLDAEELDKIMTGEESDEELGELMSSLNQLKEKGDIVTRVREHLSVRWKERRDMYSRICTLLHWISISETHYAMKAYEE